jgi:hypothetical protein
MYTLPCHHITTGYRIQNLLLAIIASNKVHRMNLGQGCPLALISGHMPHGCMHLRPAHYTGETTPQASITCACQGGYCDVWDGTGLVGTTNMAACMVMDRSMGDLAHSALAGGCVLSGKTHL